MSARHEVSAARPSACDGEASIHARLRAATAPLHHILDARLGFLLAPGLPLARYRALLGALHGFYAPLEPQLASAAACRPAFPVPLAARTRLLQRDLEALGLSAQAVLSLPHCRDLPVLPTLNQVAGALYVVEGAALGGQVIARALSRGLALTALGGAAFFGSDGARVAPRWKQVLAWLEAVEREWRGGAEMIGAACETFAHLDRWLLVRGVVA
jgi:heme oxygenase